MINYFFQKAIFKKFNDGVNARKEFEKLSKQEFKKAIIDSLAEKVLLLLNI